MPSHKGSCLCGEIQYEIAEDPIALAVCHCIPCRKTSSCSASHNFQVHTDKFKYTHGTVKKFDRKGDSGKRVTYEFCPNCPTILVVDAEAFPGITIVKPGTVDDEELLRSSKPAMEIYTKNRYPWVKSTGADEKNEAT